MELINTNTTNVNVIELWLAVRRIHRLVMLKALQISSNTPFAYCILQYDWSMDVSRVFHLYVYVLYDGIKSTTKLWNGSSCDINEWITIICYLIITIIIITIVYIIDAQQSWW